MSGWAHPDLIQEKSATAATPQGDLTGRPDLTGAAVAMPAISGCQITASNIDWGKHSSFVLHGAGKEVLRITPQGELIISDPTEAAEALLAAWNRLTGRGCGCNVAEQRFLSTCPTHGERGARSAES